MHATSRDAVNLTRTECLHWPWVHFHGYFTETKLAIFVDTPSPQHILFLTYDSKTVIFATGNTVDVHFLETNYFAWNSHIRACRMGARL
jgi:hypothetical protein